MTETVLYAFHPSVLNHILDIIALIFVLGFAFSTLFNSDGEFKKPTLLRCFVTALFVLPVVFFLLHVFYLSMQEAYELKDLLENGKVYEVEGYVENYHRPPITGHDQERFDINGIHFEYSDFTIMNGYHRSASWGGVVKKNGQRLKIKYVIDAYDEDNDEEDVIIYPGSGYEHEYSWEENIILYIAEIKE